MNYLQKLTNIWKPQISEPKINQSKLSDIKSNSFEIIVASIIYEPLS